MEKRIVTVFSTKGQRMVKIESSAETWGELKKDLDANNIEYNNMQAVVRETKAILKLDDAVLPKGITAGDKVTNEVTLFLSPTKSSAGCSFDVDNASFRDLREFIKEQKQFNEEASEFFGDYTRLSTEDLRELVVDYLDNYGCEESEDDGFSGDETQPDSDVQKSPISLREKVVALFQEVLSVLDQIEKDVPQTEFETLSNEAEEIFAELNSK